MKAIAQRLFGILATFALASDGRSVYGVVVRQQ
jgi:hypothetical protein